MRNPLNVNPIGFTRLIIGGKKWCVDPSLDFEDDCYGSTKCGVMLIQYDPRLPLDRLRDVIWHEIKHACAWESGLSYYCTDKEIEVNEEMIVRALTPVELDVLRRNPKLVAFLLEKP